MIFACRGFPPALMRLKAAVSAAHPGLPRENPGSRWPKTSLGAVRDKQRLTPEQLTALIAICKCAAYMRYANALRAPDSHWALRSGEAPAVDELGLWGLNVGSCRSGRRARAWQVRLACRPSLWTELRSPSLSAGKHASLSL